MFLKFNCLLDDLNNKSNIILFHIDALSDKKLKEFIQNNKSMYESSDPNLHSNTN